jgi:2'-5' RNA ligase
MNNAPDTTRLFLALWPGPGVRNSLREWRDGWKWPKTASPVRTEQLHLTLHFLGNIPTSRVPELVEGLSVPFSPFDLRFGHPVLWPHSVAVLEPNAVPQRLLQLHASLGDALHRLDLPTEAREFRPHVTLARRAGSAEPPAHGRPLRWRVRGYVLVESRPGGYRVIQRYT